MHFGVHSPFLQPESEVSWPAFWSRYWDSQKGSEVESLRPITHGSVGFLAAAQATWLGGRALDHGVR